MQQLERTIVLTASLGVLAAVAGIPSVVSEFPANLVLLAVPGGIVLLIPAIHRSDERPPTVFSVFVETAGPCVGYAVAFHLYYGVWDFQGVWVGASGLLLLAPLVIVLSCTRR